MQSDTALPFSVFLACLVTIQSFVLCCSSSPHGSPHQPYPPLIFQPPHHLLFIPSPPPLHSPHASSSSSLSSLSSTHAWLSTTERLKIAPGIPASVQMESWGGCGERQLIQGHKTPLPHPSECFFFFLTLHKSQLPSAFFKHDPNLVRFYPITLEWTQLHRLDPPPHLVNKITPTTRIKTSTVTRGQDRLKVTGFKKGHFKAQNICTGVWRREPWGEKREQPIAATIK